MKISGYLPFSTLFKHFPSMSSVNRYDVLCDDQSRTYDTDNPTVPVNTIEDSPVVHQEQGPHDNDLSYSDNSHGAPDHSAHGTNEVQSLVDVMSKELTCSMTALINSKIDEKF